MKCLKEQVEALEKEYNIDEQVGILQEIAAHILNNFVIEIEGTTIEPLRLEAYYYPQNVLKNSTTLVCTTPRKS